MTTDAEIYSRLLAPFPACEVHWRVGATNGNKTKGIPLAYIDARNVMDRLDDVLGWDCWQDAYQETQSGIILCALALFINGEWITKTDGAGRTDVEAEKGGVSDAFKRAAVKFGIGRYLYKLPNIWVPIEQRGKTYYLVSAPTLPDWALPENERGQRHQAQGRGPVETNGDVKSDIVSMLENLAEIVGREEAKSKWVNLLKHSEHSGGALDLDSIRDNGRLVKIKQELADVIEANKIINGNNQTQGGNDA